jgi:DNA-binding response OmpR family regulator
VQYVAVAFGHEDAAALAAELAERTLVPVMAFDREQFLRAVRGGADVAIVQPHVVGSTALLVAASERRMLLVVVADASRLDDDVRAVATGILDPGTPPATIAERTVAFVQQRARHGQHGTITWGPLVVDLDRRRAEYEGSVVDVTPLQFRLLASLARAQGAVRTRDELQRELWPGEPNDDGRRLDAHVRRLRGRLGEDANAPRFLLTVRGEGFRLADADEYVCGR